jgi:hypothetical protein
VGETAQRALRHLGQTGNEKLFRRAVDTLQTQYASALADEHSLTVVRRSRLFRLLASLAVNCPHAAGSSAAAESSPSVDFLIEQAVNEIELCGQSAADEAAAAEIEALREAAEQLLVQIAAHHMPAVLKRLLSRLDGASMFQQQKAQAAARAAAQRSRAGTQWFADKDARPTGGDHRLVGILSAVEAVARGTPQISLHFKKVLAALLPVIGLATSPASREAWSRAMCACCEAVSAHDEELQASAAAAEVKDTSTRLAMLAGYDVVASSWSSSNDASVQRSAFLALAAMTSALPVEDRRERIPPVISKLCQILSSANCSLAVRVCAGDGALQAQMRTLIKSLCSVLDTALASSSSSDPPESAADDCSHVVASLAPAIMAAVAPIVCKPPNLLDKGALTAFNHSLECFRLLASVDAAAVADFLVCALAPDGKILSQKPGAQRGWGALAVLKHVHQDMGTLLHGLLCAALRHTASRLGKRAPKSPTRPGKEPSLRSKETC